MQQTVLDDRKKDESHTGTAPPKKKKKKKRAKKHVTSSSRLTTFSIMSNGSVKSPHLPPPPPLPPLLRLSGIITAFYITFILTITSFLINFLQLICWSLLFLDSTLRLSLRQSLANFFWSLFCFCTECWSNVDYIWTGDPIPHDECAILIGNHAAGIDFVSGIVIAAQAMKIGCGRMMTMMKQSLLFVPAIGWTHYLQGSLFLKRNWEKDQKVTKHNNKT